MHRGFVKEYRKMTDWQWYCDINTCHLFRHLKLIANHKTGYVRGIKVEKGQTLTGRKELARNTGLSERQVRTSLNKLKMTNDLTIKATNTHSIITIVNYCKYNDNEHSSDHQTVQPDAIKRPASDHQATTNKNDKNEENEEKFNQFWKLYPNKNDKKKAKSKFLILLRDKNFDFDFVMAQLKKRTETNDWIKDNRKYVPLPTRWLNGERWNDEIESTTLNFTINTPPEFK